MARLPVHFSKPIPLLEEHGIEITAVAGTSMGAYVGALYAAGYNGRELEGLAREISSVQELAKLVDPAFPPRRGFLFGKRIIDRLRKSLGTRRIEDLPKTLRIVATELHTFRERVFRDGDIVDAVWASSAIPGVCVPVELDGVEYIDGAVGNPLPVDLIREDVDLVIAVTVLPALADLTDGDSCGSSDFPQMPLSIWRATGLWLNRNLNPTETVSEIPTEDEHELLLNEPRPH